MVEPVRHRQTKGAETDMLNLPPPRYTSTLPQAALTPSTLSRKGFGSGHCGPRRRGQAVKARLNPGALHERTASAGVSAVAGGPCRRPLHRRLRGAPAVTAASAVKRTLDRQG